MAKVSTKSMSPEEHREYLREIGRRGGKTRATQFTPAFQRAARKKVSRESCQRNGSKGAEQTKRLYGHEVLFEASRRKRLEFPSPNELVVIGLLKTLKVEFEREYRLGQTLYTLDFFIAAHGLGIEVDGAIHDPGKPGYEKRQECEKRKAAICKDRGIALIRIHHTELAGDDLSGVIHKIQEIAGSGEIRQCEPAQTGIPGQYSC